LPVLCIDASFARVRVSQKSFDEFRPLISNGPRKVGSHAVLAPLLVSAFHGAGKLLLPPNGLSFFIPVDGIDDQSKKDDDHKN
jgi:hypothetical protein